MLEHVLDVDDDTFDEEERKSAGRPVGMEAGGGGGCWNIVPVSVTTVDRWCIDVTTGAARSLSRYVTLVSSGVRSRMKVKCSSCSCVRRVARHGKGRVRGSVVAAAVVVVPCASAGAGTSTPAAGAPVRSSRSCTANSTRSHHSHCHCLVGGDVTTSGRPFDSKHRLLRFTIGPGSGAGTLQTV